MFSNTATTICKSLQALGLNPRKEHQIENTLITQLGSSGPDFVLSRLSALVDWRKEHMKGNTLYHAPWFRYTIRDRVSRPTDPLGSQLWNLSDKAFFAVTGAIRKAVTYEVPTEKQLNKWVDAIRCDNRSDDTIHLPPLKLRDLAWMERSLRERWSGRPWFNVSDVSGTCIPGGPNFMMMKRNPKTGIIEPISLFGGYNLSLKTAPLLSWVFLRDISAPQLMAEDCENSEKLAATLATLIERKCSDLSLLDIAENGYFMLDDEEYTRAKEFTDFSIGNYHPVGQIGLLQQEKGKLRTVANPNRFVQWCTIPFGEMLSDFVYNMSGCYVTEQQAGMKWVQEQLRLGNTICSSDMSSATDRLDFEKFLNDKFKYAFQHPDKFPLLVRNIEFFIDVSKGLWTIPGSIADLLGNPYPTISWSVGQPLGLRPSFPLLTWMNLEFARQATIDNDGSFDSAKPTFCVVGDDLDILNKYADRYNKYVEGYNGLINHDKSLISDRIAEFCSHVITKSSIFPTSPKWTLGSNFMGNLEKFSIEGLHPHAPFWSKRAFRELSRYHIDDGNVIPYSITSTPAPLWERQGCNTLLEVLSRADPDPTNVTLETLFNRAAWQETAHYAWTQLYQMGLSGRKAAKEVAGMIPTKVSEGHQILYGIQDWENKVYNSDSGWASAPYPSFGGEPSIKPEVHLQRYESAEKTEPVASEYIGAISSDTSTSVEVPYLKRWDYTQNKYVRVVPNPERDKARDLTSMLSHISVIRDDSGIIEGVHEDEHTKTTVLIDNSEEPTVLVGTTLKDINLEYVAEEKPPKFLKRKP